MAQVDSFARGYSVFPESFDEKTIFSSLNGLDPLVKNQLPIYVGIYFWPLFFSTGFYVCPYASTTLFWLL